MELLKSAENVLNILCLWESNKEQSLGLNEISKLTGINKSTVHKILQSLKKRNFVQQNEVNRKYSLGVGILRLGTCVLKNLDLREVAHPLLKQLAHMCQNTVTLGIRSDNNFIFIDRIDGRDNVRFYCDIGKVTPFYGGAAAKALFAHLSDGDINKILQSIEEKKFTKKTKGKSALMEEIKSIRKNGFSISDEEVDIGVLAVGAPIFDYSGKAIAGVAIAGIKQTFTSEILEINKKLLLEYTHIISKKMGCSSNTYK
ncbi:IclR family transcriptional regulator [Maledivibacter halophilus]|uniref:Transcriptional regulator, IclR family n=1 Tax=Maledivibacter halophilus TaxID=36842 RepID=A0A1T5M853_9FIRM|nr:IclR family transcriptional regulator [Maledivibacter halophilus]SKC84426.1 transcriptional regulator, IclR family [Maledivibacter halophilus]